MKSNSLRYTRFVHVAGLVSLLVFAALPLRAMAETSAASAKTPAAPAAKSHAPAINQLLQRYKQVSTELSQIRSKALKSDPALIKKGQALRQQMIDVMKKNGEDPQPMLDTLKSLGKQLQSKTLSASKREQLLGKARQTESALVAAERKALQNPKLQAEGKTFQQTVLADMRKVNPNTDKLIAELHSLSAQIMKASQGSPK